MIGVDTNVLVRFFASDDAHQAAAVRAWLDDQAGRGERIRIGLVTLVETEWVLRSRYRVTRDELAGVLDELLEDPSIDFQDEAAVSVASRDLAESSADFTDLLMAAVNDLHGCSTTMTIDRRAARDAGMTLLE